MSGKVLSVKDLKNVLPQRYPLLMLDRVCAVSETEYVGLKTLCINELFFQGHFPDHPIMPGVLQVEAMKQLAQVAVAEKLDPEGNGDIYMKVVEKVKFRKPNLPGDRVKIEAKVIEVADGQAVVDCKTSNNSGIACQAKITLAVRSKTAPEIMPEMWNEYDKSENTLMDISRIKELVPHRYPFLLIDNIATIDDVEVVAIKNVTINEEIFANCPDDYAVVPESLQCEIIAQAGCACVLSRPENKGKLGLFMSISRAEAFAPIFPGDQMVCRIKVPAGSSRFGKGNGIITVNDKKVFECALMFAIVAP
ncbi:3-hydroxyacyl-ACP dehydratase FabZ [Lentisphaerota bacterium ZTH]|nr:3-hydroxyacyl-ACP dehydratase FabZ [Lentisphaerota bacterium]WET05709.1 3-hydroxyacyl-ACP dehydratase FabZ [Lentisphaerota bacterium ZTH]